jgi:hypothetical protein
MMAWLPKSRCFLIPCTDILAPSTNEHELTKGHSIKKMVVSNAPNRRVLRRSLAKPGGNTGHETRAADSWGLLCEQRKSESGDRC